MSTAIDFDDRRFAEWMSDNIDVSQDIKAQLAEKVIPACDAAELLGITTATLRRRVKAGKITPIYRTAMFGYWFDARDIQRRHDDFSTIMDEASKPGNVLITRRSRLNNLPKGTVILCQIEEYHGVFEMTNVEECVLGADSGCLCGGWTTFETLADGTVEVIEDWLPELPVVVVAWPSE